VDELKADVSRKGYGRASEQDTGDAILEDREGLPRWMEEVDFKREYRIEALLGKGKFASVFRCNKIASKEKFAAKLFYKEQMTKPKLYQIIKEAIYSRRVAHPRVCQMVDLVETPERMILIQECLEGGELYKAMTRN